MSQLDLPPSAQPTYFGETQTSKLAVFAFFSSMFCLPGISGVLGVTLGLVALRQIQSTSTLEGANLAWMGIIGGLFNILTWGSIGLHYVQTRDGVDAPATAFVTDWMKSELDGEAAAAPGLRPLMRRGTGETLRTAMQQRLGPLKGLGPRSDYHYAFDTKGEHITSTYPVHFGSGAPCTATFEFAKQAGHLQVVGFSFDSPMLRDMVVNHQNALHGSETPELHDFEGPDDDARPSRLKTFTP